MNNILNSAIQSVKQSKAAWCRYITGNDTGATGSHQAGFYIPKCASSLLFDTPGIKGENKEKEVCIKWQDDFTTISCMKYYGQGTRNEYRVTRFGRDFPFLDDENVGNLLIIAKQTENEYAGYVLSDDDDIKTFLECFGLADTETNRLIDKSGHVRPEERISRFFDDFVTRFDDFPDTRAMAIGARECYNKAYGITTAQYRGIPDDLLVAWTETELHLFCCLERKFYAYVTERPFDSVSSFILAANKTLNRRKSRAGKSLELHLSDIFTNNDLVFEEQAVTEDRKKPDFLFPNGKCYHDIMFPTEQLIVLGVKTTCKDRWRQVLTEADRVGAKHLFTLQQAISDNQLKEMCDAHLTIVAPRQIKSSYSRKYQGKTMDLSEFISFVQSKQEHLPRHYLI